MRNKIRILVDCHVFDGTFQGTTTYLKGIYSKFILDDNYHFFLTSNNATFLKTVFGDRDNVTYLQYKFTNKFARLLYDIPALIHQYKIDFAHFQYIVPPIKNCKFIVTIHDILFMDFPEYFPLSYRLRNAMLFKRSALKSDIVLTVSEFSKEAIQKHFKINQVTVTPNAVDPIYFEPYDKVAVKTNVYLKYGLKDYWIYVSRWEPRKNHVSLLKVFVENDYYKDYSLVFVGNEAIEDKKYSNYYEALPTDIKSKIKTLRNIDFSDLVLVVKGADLSVYPSFAEGFGIPPLEALAAHVPSICSNTTGMSDFTFMKSMQFSPDKMSEMKSSIETNLNCPFDNEVLHQMEEVYNWDLSVLKLKLAIERLGASSSSH